MLTAPARSERAIGPARVSLLTGALLLAAGLVFLAGHLIAG